MPAPASVASSLDTVLALMPVRRAISFVPSSDSSSDSASSTASARSTAATWRMAGCPVLGMVVITVVKSIRAILTLYCPGGNTHEQRASGFVTLRRPRRPRPRPLERVPPRARPRRERQRLRARRHRPREEPPRSRCLGYRVRRRAELLLLARDGRSDQGVGRAVRVGSHRLRLP